VGECYTIFVNLPFPFFKLNLIEEWMAFTMKIEQRQWTATAGWLPDTSASLSNVAQLVLVFGSTALFRDPSHFTKLKETYPRAHILGCTTAGEIYGTRVCDDSLVCTAIYFEHTQIQIARTTLDDMEHSFQAGERLAKALPQENLVHVFVISDGLKVNGSELVKGLTQHLPSHVAITGGLSGDGARFEQTLVCLDNAPAERQIAVVGFYGDRLKVGYGSMGGWDAFGVEWIITKSKGNVLYELDSQSALELYKRYLGDHAAELPASGLLFPLSLRMTNGDTPVVRTILGINSEDQSMIFAGDVPQGARARFMKANFDRLIDGASDAATTSYEAVGSLAPDLAILISCVGRKLVLKQRIEDEVESVRDVLGPNTILTGFYSYGEISPFTPSAKCELHNQTMTITTFSER
jgi:hypothetical protein